MTPTQHAPTDPKLADILDLIRDSFAYMDGRIDPPSSMHTLTLERLAQQAASGEVWSLGPPPVACMILTPHPGALYLGKMAIAPSHRGMGLARQLIDIARSRAAAYDLPRLELQSRVELTEVHTRFAALGFRQTGTTTHAGYDWPTSIVMQLDLDTD
ncbi:GNAT family N-acetyltransferase [Phaeobacter marinintestinus]|uniref:GNAT family N-acetyltransferase n=1 Tax=Falsiphaeobacter marinintestinus TaxID=1492905 RepID=UPI0011B5F1C3|nr:GNAT family N-acetyltransferase [Phaeobacter marinintestinus]